MVVWLRFTADTPWGAVVGGEVIWLPAILRADEVAEYERTRHLCVDARHVLLGSLVFFLGPAPSHLGVTLPSARQLVLVLQEAARDLEWPSLEHGVSALVRMMVDQLGLQLTRRALVGGLRAVPGSALLKHDFVVASWRMVELQSAVEARATVLEILRLYPDEWVAGLPVERHDLIRLILLAALRHAGREQEARRYLESEVRPRLTNPMAPECLEQLLAMPEVDAARWQIVGEDGGTYIYPECSVLVPFGPLDPVGD